MELTTGECFPGLVEKLQSGEVAESLIDTALVRRLNLKDKLGLLDGAPIYRDGPFDFDPPENRKLDSLGKEAICKSLYMIRFSI